MLHGVDHADDYLMTSTSQGPQPHDNVVLSTVVLELLVTHTALVVSRLAIVAIRMGSRYVCHLGLVLHAI